MKDFPEFIRNDPVENCLEIPRFNCAATSTAVFLIVVSSSSSDSDTVAIIIVTVLHTPELAATDYRQIGEKWMSEKGEIQERMNRSIHEREAGSLGVEGASCGGGGEDGGFGEGEESDWHGEMGGEREREGG